MNKPINKENSHPDIGKSKYRVRNHYTCWVEYDVVANSKDEAESIVSDQGGLERIEWTEGYHKDEPVEVYCSDWNYDSQGDSDFEKYGREPRVQKVAECVPYEEQNIDTNEWEDNYEDPEWTKDSYRWTEEEKETSDKKVPDSKEMPF